MTHRRADPAHRFDSAVALPLLFLDELPDAAGRASPGRLRPTPHRRLRPTAIRFRRGDYLPSDALTLHGAVEDAVAGAGGSVRGPVAMLGHVRTWGWLFNPLTLYYCFDPSGRDVEWTVLEVSNTPWHERCPTSSGRRDAHASPRPCTSRPSCRRRPSTPCATRRRGRRCRVSLDVAAHAAARALWSMARAGPDHDPAPVGRRHGAATPPARSRRSGPPAVGPPVHDGAGLGGHLRPGAATGRARGPRSTRTPVRDRTCPARWPSDRGRDHGSTSGCPR